MSILAPNYPTRGKMTRAGLICATVFLIVFSACRKDKTPAGVLNKEEYAAYLVNIYIAEAKLNTYAITSDSAMQLFQPFEASLMEKYNKDDSTIYRTYSYYLAHPDQFEQVYLAVIDTLNLLEQKAATTSPQ